MPSRGAESGADGGGSRTTYIAARSSNPGSPTLSSRPSADVDDLDELARLRVRSPAMNAEAMDVEQPGGEDARVRGRPGGQVGRRAAAGQTTARQQLFQTPGASTSTAAAAAATAAYQSAQNARGLRVLDPGAPTDQASRDAAAAAAAAAASADRTVDQPCTVKLKIWRYDKKNPLAPLSDARLVIPHAVLCSEMGRISPRAAVCWRLAWRACPKTRRIPRRASPSLGWCTNFACTRWRNKTLGRFSPRAASAPRTASRPYSSPRRPSTCSWRTAGGTALCFSSSPTADRASPCTRSWRCTA